MASGTPLVWRKQGRNKVGDMVVATVLADGSQYEVREHPGGIINLWVMADDGARLLSMGFKSVETAQYYVQRLAADRIHA